MKLKSIGRAALATGMSLAIGLGSTACSRDYTVAYVYSISSQNATISAYAVDYQSGALTQINGSPFSGTGQNPVAVAVTPDGNFLYVVSQKDSNVVEYAIGTDGKLYGQNTYNLTGSFGTAAAIDSTGTYLYVTYQFQTGFGSASPGPGGITIFPITQSGSNVGSLGTAINVNVGNNPVSIAISNPTILSGATSSNVYAYVVDAETSTTGPTVIGFLQNQTNGALTLLPGSSCTTTSPTACTGAKAGVEPSSIVVEPTTKYVYVTDKASNAILGYGINGAGPTAGGLTPLVTSPFSTGTGTGLFPVNLTIEPRGKFLFTANQTSNTVSSFAINIADGSLSGVATTGAATVGTSPTCVTVEPALGIYLYTSNLVDASISAEKIDPNTGQLSGIDNTPFPTGQDPSCVTAVANGNHAHAQSVIVN
jgi:6-phosphogluconolactonase